RKNKPLIAGGRFWRAVSEADRRRLVGRYSGLLLHIRDSQPWDRPVTGKVNGLAKVTPAWAGCLKPKTFDEKQDSETYG
ncbi:anti-CBASS protein Acb1 family protein, partial [Pseudomonas aeruginosa]